MLLKYEVSSRGRVVGCFGFVVRRVRPPLSLIYGSGT